MVMVRLTRTQKILLHMHDIKMKKVNINLKKLNWHLFASLPASQKRMTIPNMLTLGRMASSPVIGLAMAYSWWQVAFILFVVASLTDVVDGALARLLHQKTFLGACLDPIADKTMILSVFITLAFVNTPLFALPKWFVCLVLSKEILQIGGAVALYVKNGYLDVRPTWLGKFAGFVQTSFVLWLFACYFFEWMPIKTYYAMLGLVLVVVFASLIHYTIIAKRSLQKQ